MKNDSFVSRLFTIFSARTHSGGAKVLYSSEGRHGYVHYKSSAANFSMYYEFGGGNCVVSIDIPSIEHWKTETGLSPEHRDNVLNFIGQQVVKDQTTGGGGYFKIESNWLNIYV